MFESSKYTTAVTIFDLLEKGLGFTKASILNVDICLM